MNILFLLRLYVELSLFFFELGYTPHLDSPFSAEELAGLLYNLWQALDQCGISNQSNPESIINLLKQAYFIQCVLDGGFLRGNCQCLEEQALQFAEQEALAVRRQKRKVVLDVLPQSKSSPAYFTNSEQRTIPKTVEISNNTAGFYLPENNFKQKKRKKETAQQEGWAGAVLYNIASPNEEFSQPPFIDWVMQEAGNDSIFSLQNTLFSSVLPPFSSKKQPIS